MRRENILLMIDLPFELPKSLASYAEQFDRHPLKTISRLKSHLNKRGGNALGYFLLSWFYHVQGQEDEAVTYSLRAKILAPGSPFFEKLHYYLSHPQTFEAWTPSVESSGTPRPAQDKKVSLEPVLDLDQLISRLSEIDSGKISPPAESKDPETLDRRIKESHPEVDSIVSETLAGIHESQGKTEAAIRTYKRLKQLNSDKKGFYDEKISSLEKIQQEESPAGKKQQK